MSANKIFLLASALGIAAVRLSAQCPPGPTTGNPAVLTSQYDNQRDAYNSSEVCLTSTALSTGSVKLGQTRVLEVDDNPSALPTLGNGQQPLSNPIYAQPLYVPQISIAGGVHNAVIVATLNDSIFAWDADNGGCTTAAPVTCNPPLWARESSNINPGYPPGAQGTNALWYDDCPGGHVPVGNGFLSFIGILGTPVVDLKLNSIFAVAYCVSSQGTFGAYLHQISLSDGHDLAVAPIGDVGGSINFDAAEQHQRAALLEVSPLIYVAFGTGTTENIESPDPYHGWLFAYDVSSGVLSPNPVVSFVSTQEGCGAGGGVNAKMPQCAAAGKGTPPCDCQIETVDSVRFQNVPNWGGHGGGIWMSGRGPAATAQPLSDANFHVFLGVGNGGFQSGRQNWGESVLDFRMPVNGVNPDSEPFQFMAPQGGPKGCGHGNACKPAVQPVAADACYNFSDPKSSPAQCPYTVETMNANDWDMSVSGMLLFNDLNGVPRVLTLDKAGFGYLMTQGNLCGAPDVNQLPTEHCASPINPAGTVQGFAAGDPGNVFPFLATKVPCPSGPNLAAGDCDRVTSMAFYNNRLYFWPDNSGTANEWLTALQLSDNVTEWPGITQLGQPALIKSSTANGATTVTFASCPSGDNCAFSTQLIPGDTLTAASSPPQTGIVTSVTNTQITVSGFTSDVNDVTFAYRGYFVNPTQQSPQEVPSPSTTGYAGGSLVVTSSAPNSSDGVVWALVSDSMTANQKRSSQILRTQGNLYAYDANPADGGGTALNFLWSSAAPNCPNCQAFCTSSFALPTVVHGQVFVPTFAINLPNTSSGYCPPSTQGSYESGVLVYGPQ